NNSSVGSSDTPELSDPADIIELIIELGRPARVLQGDSSIMCLPGQPPAPPATAGEALAAISAGLDYLNAADVASLTTAEQAGGLRARERAPSMQPAARSRVRAASHAQDGCAGDGHGSPRTGLKWQTRISGGAASGALGWMRRLRAPPAVGDALAQASISE